MAMASSLNVVDSSAWLEYLTGGIEATRFAAAIEDSKNLIVPAIVLYEALKKVLRERGEQQALQVAGAMHAGKVVPVDAALALDAARVASGAKYIVTHNINDIRRASEVGVRAVAPFQLLNSVLKPK